MIIHSSCCETCMYRWRSNIDYKTI